jgi:transcriptional regulator with XRE-family HTH domain
VTKPQPETYPNDLKTLGDHLRRCRIERNLFQREIAVALGVHPLTITNWELNTTTPPMAYIPAIIRFLGYEPSLLPVAAQRRRG